MDYAPYYCEENIWKYLCKLPPAARADAWAVFIFGSAGSVPMFRQRAGSPPQGAVLWDYHVVAVETGFRILDFDTTLGFCTDARLYLDESFGDGRPKDSPLFRILGAADFCDKFYSDRSHMRAADGGWLQPQPPWPHPDGSPWTLSTLLNPSCAEPGLLVDLAGFKLMGTAENLMVSARASPAAPSFHPRGPGAR